MLGGIHEASEVPSIPAVMNGYQKIKIFLMS